MMSLTSYRPEEVLVVLLVGLDNLAICQYELNLGDRWSAQRPWSRGATHLDNVVNSEAVLSE